MNELTIGTILIIFLSGVGAGFSSFTLHNNPKYPFLWGFMIIFWSAVMAVTIVNAWALEF